MSSLECAETSELEQYLSEKYFDQLVPIVYAVDDAQWHELYLDVLELLYNFPVFGEFFHSKPGEFTELIRLVLAKCQQSTIAQSNGLAYDSQTQATVKKRLDVRYVNLPPIANDVVIKNLRDLGKPQLNKLIVTFGTVMRTSNVNSRELSKKFQCKQCGKQVVCESDISLFN